MRAIRAKLKKGEKLTQEEGQVLLEADPDFVLTPHFKHSLTALLDRYPDEVPSHVIAKALGISPGEVTAMYARTIVKLRKITGMGPE